MKNSLLIFIMIVSFVCIGQAQSKPSILLMTGKEINGLVTGEDSAYIYYEYTKKSGKVKERKLDWERIFSYTTSENEEVVVYMSDTSIGNYFTEQEMRYYIKGEQDAWNGYKSNWTIWTGLPVNAGAGYLLGSSAILVAVPFVYMVVASLPKYRNTPGSISNALLKEPAYALGYERAARSKRLFKSLASGIVGAAIGLTVRELTE